jgi:hypothetical protein
MAVDPAARAGEPGMDVQSLYREEIYTDRKLATLRVLVPVKSDGSPDPSRSTQFLGEAQLMTNMGPLPISFDIPANDLAEAIARYGEAAKSGVENAVRELQEMRRQASSSLVIPSAGATSAIAGGGGLPGLGGGLPGGGKIQMP